MQLRRVLFAFELGGNWGHLSRAIPVALALRERGYQALFAVRDSGTAEAFLAPLRFPFINAPAPTAPPRRALPPANYADSLISEGYANPDALRGTIRSWLTLFGLIQPALLVADFAPAAMLAARVSGCPLVVLGNGYEIPPPVGPSPSIRPWESISEARLGAADDELLACMNAALTSFGGRPLRDLAELHTGPRMLLATFPELDQHGPRSTGTYIGTIYCTPAQGIEVPGLGDARPRILGYLRPHTRGLRGLVEVVKVTGQGVLCIPKADADIPASGSGCRIYTSALKLDSLLPQADLMVTNGSSGTTARALLAGVPVLTLPNTVEQRLTGLRVEALGAGRMALSRTQQSLREAVESLIGDERFRIRAREFAGRYKGETTELAVGRAVAMIESAARQRSLQPP